MEELLTCDPALRAEGSGIGRWAKGVGNVERNGAGGGALLGDMLQVAGVAGVDGGGEGDGEYIDDEVSDPVELRRMAQVTGPKQCPDGDQVKPESLLFAPSPSLFGAYSSRSASYTPTNMNSSLVHFPRLSSVCHTDEIF